MEGKYKVVTLCGSTRFKDQFIEAQKRLTLEGNIVISVGLHVLFSMQNLRGIVNQFVSHIVVDIDYERI